MNMAGIPEMSSFHVGVAAEAFAAGFFAQAGCDVSVQYGANQPEYDLLVARDTSFLRISVKGSQSGSWGLVQGYKKGRSYHEAVDAWAESHKPHTVYCFIQFWGVPLCQAPRAYLATVPEIVTYMKASRMGTGATILRENYSFKRGVAAGSTDSIPGSWAFTRGRVDELLIQLGRVA